MLFNFSSSPKKGLSGAKPFNPVLGEQYNCTFEHEDSKTEFYSEQVSHHPPVSAWYMKNEKLGFVYSGWANPDASFYGNSVQVSMDKALFRFDNLKTGEQFKITSANLVLGGIFFGEQEMRMGGKMVIKGEKYRCDIDFSVNLTLLFFSIIQQSKWT